MFLSIKEFPRCLMLAVTGGDVVPAPPGPFVTSAQAVPHTAVKYSGSREELRTEQTRTGG